MDKLFRLNYTVSKYKHDIDDYNKSLINTIIFKDYPSSKKRVVTTENNLCIKFLSSNNKYDQIEIKLIKDYLDNQIGNVYFFPYLAILNILDINNVYITNYDTCIVMPKFTGLNNYLDSIHIISSNLLLSNIGNILNLAIFIRDKYKFFHADLKIDNILINNNIFYIIDWEITIKLDNYYDNEDRPENGNTEMYPHYNTTSEEYFIYSIGVLLVRILGYNYCVTYKDFVDDHNIDYILSKIPNTIIYFYQPIIELIFYRKEKSIEYLLKTIENLMDSPKEI